MGLRNAAQKGRRNEHRSIEILEAAGYQCVRSAASKGTFDIIGLSFSGVCLVQVKTRDWPSQAEIEQMKYYPCPPGTQKIIHRWRDYKQQPDVHVVA